VRHTSNPSSHNQSRRRLHRAEADMHRSAAVNATGQGHTLTIVSRADSLQDPQQDCRRIRVAQCREPDEHCTLHDEIGRITACRIQRLTPQPGGDRGRTEDRASRKGLRMRLSSDAIDRCHRRRERGSLAVAPERWRHCPVRGSRPG
jgi:hypothetical protein